MTTPSQYRAHADKYSELIKGTDKSDEGPARTLTEEEGRILRCLGASVIMQWNTLPRKLQRELFDNASSVGELLETGAFKQQMARFLHNHKDDEAGMKIQRNRTG